MTVEAIVLIPRAWVGLPGTDWQVFLKGRGTAGRAVTTIYRSGPPTGVLGGWGVPRDQVYLRMATPATHRRDGALKIRGMR